MIMANPEFDNYKSLDQNRNIQEAERVAKCGVAVLVLKESSDNIQVLFGLRKTDIPDYGNGLCQLPGGKVAHMESLEAAGIREVKEETNLDVEDLEFLTVKPVISHKADIHYVCCFFIGRVSENSDELINREPDKNEDWVWFPITSPPNPNSCFINCSEVIKENLDRIKDYWANSPKKVKVYKQKLNGKTIIYETLKDLMRCLEGDIESLDSQDKIIIELDEVKSSELRNMKEFRGF
jgi:8-oxo-dGTP diphosphatase